jgi:predicted dehydrogenase
VINVGIIGTGVGLRSIRPAFERTGRARVTAVAGSSPQRVREKLAPGDASLAVEVDELCDRKDVDLICVASPTSEHARQAKLALASGRHVYLEKPLAENGVAAGEVREAAAAASVDSGRVIVLGHQLRFNPYFRAMRDCIRKGDLGRIYSVEIAQQGGGFSKWDRAWTWEFEVARGGGVRLAMGSHLHDLCYYLTGLAPESVLGFLDPVHPRRMDPDRGELRKMETSAFYAAELRLGESYAHVSSTAAGFGPFRFDVVVRGDSGELRFDVDGRAVHYGPGSSKERLCSRTIDEDYDARPGTSIFSTSFTYMAEELVVAIEGGGGAPRDAATVDDGVRLAKELDAGLQSFLTSSVVSLGDGVRDVAGY